MINVLFCQVKSNYHNFPCKVWTKQNDAFTIPGSNVVIAHPPCAQWSRLRKFSEYRPLERFAGPFSVRYVQKHGGIVEHPNGTRLFDYCGIARSKLPDQYGGFLMSVQQNWFGHPCKKETLLYIVGILPGELPPMPLSFDAIQHTVSSSKTSKNEISKKMREHTPPAFCKWLLQVAQLIEKKKSTSYKTVCNRGLQTNWNLVLI